MKYIAFIFLLLGTDVYSQIAYARIDTIEAIIIHRYSKNFTGTYCEMPTFILTKSGDSILFFQRSSFNISVLKENTSLKSIIGEYNEYAYDYMEDYSMGIFKHDLTISMYNYHTEEFQEKVVKSPSFYMKDGNNDLFSIYQFRGLIVFYEGHKAQTSEYIDECFCPLKETSYKSFAVLKEAWELKPLTDEQRLNMFLTKSGIIAIEVFYCE